MKARGFTLVEVLVALFIMAVMAGLAWRGIDGIARARDAGQQRMEQTLRLDTVITQWEQDLAALHDVGGDLSFGFDGGAVRLTRRADEGGVRLVVWQLKNGELLRWAGRPVTRLNELQEQWMRSLQFQGNEPGQLHALKGVSALRLFCFRDNAWSNCQSTGDVAAVARPPAFGGSAPLGQGQQQLLPSGVRLTLEFTGAPLAGTLTRDVVLPPQQLVQPAR
jgi:general secretion pathway protein J